MNSAEIPTEAECAAVAHDGGTTFDGLHSPLDFSSTRIAYEFRVGNLPLVKKYFLHNLHGNATFDKDRSPMQLYGQNRLYEHCKRELTAETAVLIVYIKKPTMTHIVNDVKWTFFDQLSGFGGTTGLFTGLSLISAPEFLFWILVFVASYCKTLMFSRSNDSKRKGSKGSWFGRASGQNYDTRTIQVEPMKNI